jgi:hypothetical protein
LDGRGMHVGLQLQQRACGLHMSAVCRPVKRPLPRRPPAARPGSSLPPHAPPSPPYAVASCLRHPLPRCSPATPPELSPPPPAPQLPPSGTASHLCLHVRALRHQCPYHRHIAVFCRVWVDSSCEVLRSLETAWGSVHCCEVPCRALEASASTKGYKRRVCVWGGSPCTAVHLQLGF